MLSVMASTGRLFEQGDFLGEWWDLWRSSETSVNGAVMKVNWNVLIDRDEERDFDTESSLAFQRPERLYHPVRP